VRLYTGRPLCRTVTVAATRFLPPVQVSHNPRIVFASKFTDKSRSQRRNEEIRRLKVVVLKTKLPAVVM